MQVESPFTFVKIADSHIEKKGRKPIKMWNFDEIVKYTLFLNQYLRTNRQSSIRKLKINDFLCMSQLIKSRNANQCRIFHLKLMKIGESIQEIFSLLSSNIDQYSQIYKKFKGKDRVDKSVEKTKNEGVVEQEDDKSCTEDKMREEKLLGYYQDINCGQMNFKMLTKEDWYQQLDDFLATLNNSWLDDI